MYNDVIIVKEEKVECRWKMCCTAFLPAICDEKKTKCKIIQIN